ncbi:hypothetical protein AgCh_005419 [Apium graveolens]
MCALDPVISVMLCALLGVRDEIEQLMDDNGDMAEMYLTESVNGSRWLTNFPFLQSQLKEYIDDTEDFINIQMILYGAKELEQSKHKMNDIYDDALAIHHIVYDYANSLQDAGKCVFAWNVAGGALCKLHARKET